MSLHILAHITLIGIIIFLCYDPSLGMFNRSGGRLLVILLALPCLLFGATLVFADVNRLKKINEATGDHLLTNALLRGGFRVRPGEFAWQVLGDEFSFIVWCDGPTFVARLSRQLAKQPLTPVQRRVLVDADGVDHLSATFAIVTKVRHIGRALSQGSREVLAQKAIRDSKI
jgi:GGDEF domain-containing protein